MLGRPRAPLLAIQCGLEAQAKCRSSLAQLGSRNVVAAIRRGVIDREKVNHLRCVVLGATDLAVGQRMRAAPDVDHRSIGSRVFYLYAVECGSSDQHEIEIAILSIGNCDFVTAAK